MALPTSRTLILLLCLISQPPGYGQPAEVLNLGNRRELFVDHFLVDRLDGAQLRMHQPQLAPSDDQPNFSGYTTVIKDGPVYRMYYRVSLPSAADNDLAYCYAESTDGICWTEPDLGIVSVEGSDRTNIILAHDPHATHNFAPFLDTNPAVTRNRYKALAGGTESWSEARGLYAYVSNDGIHWRKLTDHPVIVQENSTEHEFDSQNVAFWSEQKQAYICFFRSWLPHVEGKRRVRSISYTTSRDFLHWDFKVTLNPNLPDEQLYTNQTHPYFRAPHLLIALPLRFLPHHGGDIHKYSADAVLMTMRNDDRYTRTFLDAFIRPDMHQRQIAVAQNIVPTGPKEMSIYCGSRRYRLRVDGFASLYAPYSGGALISKPVVFTGGNLHLNFWTSAAGRVHVGLADLSDEPIPGRRLEDCVTLVGDQIDQVVSWQSGSDLSDLAGTPLRLHLHLRDADIYSLQFR